MRTIALTLLLGTVLLTGCTQGQRMAELSAQSQVNANCDEYEGYPDCYPDHPLQEHEVKVAASVAK